MKSSVLKKIRTELVIKYLKSYLILGLLTVSYFTPIMSQDLQEQFAQNNAQFSLDLFSKISKDSAGKNIIVSPFSIQTCVGLAYAGAAGNTAADISKGLKLVSTERNVVGESFKNVLDAYKDSPLLKIANKFYVKIGYEVKDEFNEIATKYFHSEAENIDFTASAAAAATMNGWVSAKTNDKIKDLISAGSLDSDTRMVLLNAIHFKGQWKNQFKESDTRKDDFWTSETESVKVDMMNLKKSFRHGSFDDLDATALEMPYKDSNLSMLILLPNKKTGLADLEEKLQSKSLASITENMYSKDVIVKFPKFKVEFEIELNDVLGKMGMASMFSNSADFSNLLKSPEPLQVSKVIHKAFIEVNEEGAEAAAATGITVATKCLMINRNPIPKFTADHPFNYFIKNSDDIILFAGKVEVL